MIIKKGENMANLIEVIEDHKTALMKLYSNLMHDKNTRERGIVDGMDYALADLRENMSSAQPKLTCDGCKHKGKWENEYEYGYNAPCTRCKRRVNDNYER